MIFNNEVTLSDEELVELIDSGALMARGRTFDLDSFIPIDDHEAWLALSSKMRPPSRAVENTPSERAGDPKIETIVITADQVERLF